MMPRTRRLRLTVLLAAVAWESPAYCQTQGQLPAPASSAPSGPPSEGPVVPPLLATPPMPGPPGPPLAVPPPPTMPIVPYQDRNGPLLRGDALLDRPNAPPPGWFAALELNFVGPHIKNRLQAPVKINGFMPDTVHLPTAELDWTGAPRIEVGYRWPEALGEFLVSYRFLVSEGRDSSFGLVTPDDGFLKSRLNVNVVDLDYSSREFSLEPHWDMKWRAGARIATAFFDSRAENFFLEQRTSNNFIGAGPHVGLDLWRSLDVPGLAVYSRIEGGAVVGQISQGFEEEAVLRRGLVGGATTIHHTQAVPVLSFQIGLSWTSPWRGPWRRYAIGYEFERWWYLGEAGDSRAELTSQGVFFRGEFGF